MAVDANIGSQASTASIPNYLSSNGITNGEWRQAITGVQQQILTTPQISTNYMSIPNPWPGRINNQDWVRALTIAGQEHPGSPLAVLADARHIVVEEIHHDHAGAHGAYDAGAAGPGVTAVKAKTTQDNAYHATATAGTIGTLDVSDQSGGDPGQRFQAGSGLPPELVNDLGATGFRNRGEFQNFIRSTLNQFRGNPEMGKFAAAVAIAGHNKELVSALKGDQEVQELVRKGQTEEALKKTWEKHHEEMHTHETKEQFVQHGIRALHHVNDEIAHNPGLTRMSERNAAAGHAPYFGDMAAHDAATVFSPGGATPGAGTSAPATHIAAVTKANPYAGLGKGLSA